MNNSTCKHAAWVILIATSFQSCTQADLADESSHAMCSDDFNRDDASILGNKWEIGGGSFNQGISIFGVQGNKVSISVPNSSFSYALCANRTEHRNMVTSMKFEPTTALAAGNFVLIAHAKSKTTTSDGYFCGIESNATGKLTLYKGVGGIRTQFVQSGIANNFNPGSAYNIVFSISGSNLKCTLSGAASDEISAADNTFMSGYNGFFGQGATGSISLSADDFKTVVSE